MIPSSSLLIDADAGRQVVLPPRITDAIGATLRDGYAARWRLPDDLQRLVAAIDLGNAVSDRG